MRVNVHYIGVNGAVIADTLEMNVVEIAESVELRVRQAAGVGITKHVFSAGVPTHEAILTCLKSLYGDGMLMYEIGL